MTGWFRRSPLWLKVVIGVSAVFLWAPALGFMMLGMLGYAVYAVYKGHRNALATASVALWGVCVFFAADYDRHLFFTLVLLPVVVALIAHAKPIARWFAPCRTAAWVLIWSVPIGAALVALWSSRPQVGVIAAWALAIAVLGWRTAKGLQEGRGYAPEGLPPPRAGHGPDQPGARPG